MALIDWLWFAVAAWDGNRCPYLSRHRFKGIPRLKIDGLRIGSDGFCHCSGRPPWSGEEAVRTDGMTATPRISGELMARRAQAAMRGAPGRKCNQ